MRRMFPILMIMCLALQAQTKRDPRVVAVAGAYTTIADGIFSVGYNPGIIGLQQHRPFMVQGLQLDFGILGNFFSIENIAEYSGDTLNMKEKMLYSKSCRLKTVWPFLWIHICQSLC